MIASLPILHPQNVVWSGGEIAVGRPESSLQIHRVLCTSGRKVRSENAVSMVVWAPEISL